MRFLKTVSFLTSGRFDSNKDDVELNQALRAVQQSGAQVTNIQVKLAGKETSAVSLYVIEYEADAPVG